jgi:5-methylcytosine-specific restriction endonuclease McrA
MAYTHLGNRKRGGELVALWTAQAGRCALTGASLTPGGMASVDHKVPRSRGGAQSIENVQWVLTVANLAKHTMTPEEFVALCRQVVAFCGG